MCEGGAKVDCERVKGVRGARTWGVREGRERERQEWFVREGRESECCERVRGLRVGRKSEGLRGARKWGVKEG